MEKNNSISMVKAALFALDYYDKNDSALPEEIIKEFMKSSAHVKRKKETQIYEVAAINKLCKLRNQYKLKTKKQMIQMFVNDLDGLLQEVKAED